MSSPHHRSLSFGRVIAELKAKQSLRAGDESQAVESLSVRVLEQQAELDALKASKRHTVMRMSQEIDRLRHAIHDDDERETAPQPPQPQPQQEEDDDDSVALERLLNQSRVPFRPPHPFPSLAILQQTQQTRLFSPTTQRPMPPARRVVPLSPLQPLSLRMKRKRLSVDFEGMTAEGEQPLQDDGSVDSLNDYLLEGEREVKAELTTAPAAAATLEKTADKAQEPAAAASAATVGRCLIM